MVDLVQLRKEYHKAICQQILGYQAKVPSIADKDSERSIRFAEGILARMKPTSLCPKPPTLQRARRLFEALTRDYLERALHQT